MQDDDFKSKFGKIATQTSQQGKVRIQPGREQEEDEEEEEMMEGDREEEPEDPFEEEMRKEMEQRMLQAEKVIYVLVLKTKFLLLKIVAKKNTV